MSRPKPHIRQNLYGNWYGYIGNTKTRWFYTAHEIGGLTGEEQARQWLAKQLAKHKNHETQ